MNRNFMRIALLAFGLVLLIAAGCKDSSSPTYGGGTGGGGGGGGTGGGTTVAMVNTTFSPASLTVKAGTVVTFQNSDGVAHTATDDNGGWDTGNVGGGASKTITFSTAGTFHYHCTYHRSMGMVGTIIVQ